MTPPPSIAVSRLRWNSAGSTLDERCIRSETPHVRGVPVYADRQGTRRTREWPNRLGGLEAGTAADVVNWFPALAHRPPIGQIERSKGEAPVDLDARIRWFRSFLRSLQQIPDVASCIVPDAACSIVLTRGFQRADIDIASARFPCGIGAVPERLSEFPGGIQLVLTDESWAHAEEYAEVVERLLSKD